MLQSSDEIFWDDLLTFVENGCVIPVLGEGAITCGDNDQPLYPWLARRLAERLGLTLADDGAPPTLNDIFCRHLLSGGSPNLVYLRLSQILEKECPAPGPTLRALAGIEAFRLFLTTTCDPLLVHALDAERFSGQSRTTVGAFSPEADRVDLPERLADLPGPHVHHLFGRSSPKPDYVVWEEDALEFVCGLQRRLEKMENLSRDLHQHSLLVLGLHFSDWLVRFFLRIAKQRRLSQISDHLQYLAEGPHDTLPASMVIFFGGLTKNITVIPTTPAGFLAELSRRWRERHPAPEGAAVDSRFTLPPASAPRFGDIFISYAREDETAAVQLKAALERAGCDVWFDRERLKPGAHWHAHLEDAVKNHAGLFISLISRTTESAGEAYYHLERNWAAERVSRFSEGEEFYFPVVIDDSPLLTAREPRSVRMHQAASFLGGIPSEEFGLQLRTLQQHRRAQPR